MIGDSRTSNTISSNVGVPGSRGYGYLSQVCPVGVEGLVSPVCQMPAAPGAWNSPSGLPSKIVVCPPQAPEVLYSQTLAVPMSRPGLLSGWRTPSQPPLLRSKFQGTLCTSNGFVETRKPLSTTPFGMMSPSPGSVLSPSLFTSSPSVLLTMLLRLLATNMDAKVTSSSGQ